MLEPVSIDIASLNLSSLIPMGIAVLGALSILCVDLFAKNLSKSFCTMITIIFVIFDLGAVLQYNGPIRGFFDVMLVDGIAILSQVIILVASILFIPLALTSKRFHEYSHPEFFALFLFLIAGFQFMVATDNLILIFIGLETASLALYTMIAMHNRNRSFEAAIKYFTMGALAAGFYALASFILYALTGSVEINQIAQILGERNFEPLLPVLAAVVLMLASIGFKISVVPFHTWVPDVYEGASAALAGYMSIVPKIAALVVAMRFFEVLTAANVAWVDYILYGAAVLTMTLANIMALVQDDVKRMLAYSSISHAGFVMAAITIGTTQANSGLFLYWILFMFTNLGAFAMLWISRYKSKAWDTRYDHPYSKFSGMVLRKPIAATIMALFMLSLAGVPPFSLFWGKLYIIGAAVNASGLENNQILNPEYIVLAIIMALNSAISVYYYLKLVVYMFLKDPVQKTITYESLALKTIIGFSTAATILAIFMIEPLIQTITSYVSASGF